MGNKAKSDLEKKKIVSDDYQAKMAAAVAAYRRAEIDSKTGRKKPIRQIAKDYGVKHSTLGDRLQEGAISIVEFNRTKQKLSEGGERELGPGALNWQIAIFL